MWIVAKIKNKEFNILRNSLKEKLGTVPEVYGPKILIDKFIKNKLHKKKKFILENYIFLRHDKFNQKGVLSSIQNLKGMDMILPFFNSSQGEIVNFIKKCKENENKFGFLTQNFFDLVSNKKIEFNSGPFSKFVGKLVKVQKNKITVLVENYIVSIKSKETIIF